MVAFANIFSCVYFRAQDGLILASLQSSTLPKSINIKSTVELVCSKCLKPSSQLCVTLDGATTAATTAAGAGSLLLHVLTGELDGVAVLTPSAYQKSVAVKLTASLKEKIDERIPEEAVEAAETPGLLNSVLLPVMEKECMIYDDPSASDKMAEVVQKVEEVKIVIEGNINRILEHTEDLGGVESKGDLLVAGAGTFQKSSEEIRKRIYWRNVRIKVILGVVVTVIVMYIAVPITVKFA